MVDFFLLLNTGPGNYVVQNDGTSRIILNSSTGVTTGVIIDGDHAVPLIGSISQKAVPRVKEFELIALGKVTRKLTLIARGKIFKIIESVIKSRLSRILETKIAKSKVTKLYENIEAHSFHYIDEDEYQKAKEIQERRREAKVKRLRKLFEEYKDTDDDI